MPAPTITPLPTPPSRGDAPETFNAEADAFLGALPTLQSEVNAVATWMDTTAGTVATNASTASTAATTASNAVSGVKVEFGGTFRNSGGIAAGATRLDESTQALYTMERLVLRVQEGTGSIPVYFLINGLDLVGPVTATTTLATSTISIAIPANATVDIQFGTATGTVTGVFAKMQGRIGA